MTNNKLNNIFPPIFPRDIREKILDMAKLLIKRGIGRTAFKLAISGLIYSMGFNIPPFVLNKLVNKLFDAISKKIGRKRGIKQAEHESIGITPSIKKIKLPPITRITKPPIQRIPPVTGNGNDNGKTKTPINPPPEISKKTSDLLTRYLEQQLIKPAEIIIYPSQIISLINNQKRARTELIRNMLNSEMNTEAYKQHILRTKGPIDIGLRNRIIEERMKIKNVNRNLKDNLINYGLGDIIRYKNAGKLDKLKLKKSK